MAADFDGGIGYLTNSTTALVQTFAFAYPYVGRLGPGQSIQLNSSQFTNGWAGEHFIWCGIINGNGALTLTISQGGTNTLAQTEAFIQIVEIKQMYEQVDLGDVPGAAPKTNALAAVDGTPVRSSMARLKARIRLTFCLFMGESEALGKGSLRRIGFQAALLAGVSRAVWLVSLADG